jgi:hypothetical protein
LLALIRENAAEIFWLNMGTGNTVRKIPKSIPLPVSPGFPGFFPVSCFPVETGFPWFFSRFPVFRENGIRAGKIVYWYAVPVGWDFSVPFSTWVGVSPAVGVGESHFQSSQEWVRPLTNQFVGSDGALIRYYK